MCRKFMSSKLPFICHYCHFFHLGHAVHFIHDYNTRIFVTRDFNYSIIFYKPFQILISVVFGRVNKPDTLLTSLYNYHSKVNFTVEVNSSNIKIVNDTVEQSVNRKLNKMPDFLFAESKKFNLVKLPFCMRSENNVERFLDKQ